MKDYSKIEIADKISKVLDKISESPKLIAITSISLVVIIIFVSQYDGRSILEKCADYEYYRNYKNYYPPGTQFFSGKNLKNKIEDRGYEWIYKSCEAEQKQYPSTFKEKYN